MKRKYAVADAKHKRGSQRTKKIAKIGQRSRLAITLARLRK